MDVQGVLFDLDGVLVKSMEQHLEAWQYAFKDCGVTVRAEDFYQLEGRGVKSVVEELVQKYNIDPALKSELMTQKIEYYKKIFKPLFYDGMFELLEFLKQKHVPTAVVTGGDRDRVQKLLDDHFPGYFKGLISATDVQNTKPFPEPYLKGAKMLNLPPDKCLVIENAPLGIRAGKEAGMYVIGVTTTVPPDRLHEADIIVPDIQAVRNKIIDIFSRN